MKDGESLVQSVATLWVQIPTSLCKVTVQENVVKKLSGALSLSLRKLIMLPTSIQKNRPSVFTVSDRICSTNVQHIVPTVKQ